MLSRSAIFVSLCLVPVDLWSAEPAFSFNPPDVECVFDTDLDCFTDSAQGVDGYRFQPLSDIFVTDLGYYDHSQDGLKLVHPVAIYDFEKRIPLVTADVDEDSFLDGHFRYTSIEPLQLSAGTSYVVVGFHPGGPRDLSANTPDDLQVADDLTYQGYRFNEAPQIQFPTTEYDPLTFFGPNLRFELDTTLPSTDFTGDGVSNCQDIDALVNAVVTGNINQVYDLNRDFVVDKNDVVRWLQQAGNSNIGSGYLPGDADLNGAVDAADLDIWSAHNFSSTAAWCSGDFTVDGNVDVLDFNVWNDNYETAAAESVPEPISLVVLIFLAVGLFVERGRHRGARPGDMSDVSS